MIDLEPLGWNSHWEEQNKGKGGHLGRIVRVNRNECILHTGKKAYPCGPSGDYLGASMPLSVGDWVRWLDPEPAHHLEVLPRTSRLARKAAGRAFEEQVLAVNLDWVMVVTSLNLDLNPSRLERYLAMILQSGAKPVFLLTKADLGADVNSALLQVEALAPDIPVHPLCSLTGDGMPALAPYLAPGNTIALVGSSGVGKTTLVNTLLDGGYRETREIREKDHKGRHATTARELIPLPSGSVIIDTPGMRELGLWVDTLDGVFTDIEEMARACRFRNCRHEHEPGCAVLEAMASGRLARRRLESWLKMNKEVQWLRTREDGRSRREKKARDKALARSHKTVKALKYGSRRH